MTADVRALLTRALGGAADAEQRAPLSFAQERMWFLDRLGPGQATYNMPIAVRVRGALDTAALHRAINGVVARQPALRTTFDGSSGTPVQVVHPPGDVPFVITRLAAGLTVDERENEARALLEREAGTPFNLGTGPLLRALLVVRSDDDYELLLTVHHIVADAWSVDLILDEISVRYRALLTGTPAHLPDLPRQYADYSSWQREHLDAAQLERHLAYWTRHLDGAPPVLELPSDRARPPVQSYAGGNHVAYLSAEATDMLADACRDHDGTLFMGVLAAFKVVLGRITGQADLVVSTPVAGRTHADLDGVAGLFVNTLALRTSLAGNPPFAELLGRVRETTLSGLEHQELPFEKLVEALAPERSLGHAPVSQVQLVFQAEQPDRLQLPGATTEVRGQFTHTSKLDLTVYAEVEATGRLALVLEYRADLFDPPWAQRLADSLLSVLEHAGADPATRVGDLRLLSSDQLAEVLTAPNDVPQAAPLALGSPSVLDALRAQRTAEIQVTGSGQGMTLKQVLDWAARIGSVLRRHGVGRETPVGLCVDRSPGMLAALLGVWAAGGSYVPLDPGFPVARLRMMVEDSGVRHLLTEQALGDVAAAVAPGAHRLEVDGPDVASASASLDPAHLDWARIHPAQAAYTIFTSGSTGRPKGVTVTHGAVANLVESFHRTLDLSRDDCFVAVTTLSFDIALLELLLPLRAGARLTIADKAQAGDPDLLRQLLAAARASVLQATPATWRMLLASGGVPPSVRVRLCGGEALPRDLADELSGPGSQLWNVYGPTETTVWSAAGMVAPSPEPIVIGPPIAGTRLYVLDRRQHPVPRGIVGELHIAGDGLARGYLEKPGQTASRFVPDPFAAAPGSRIYRTGDLARWLPAGRLEILGRIDNQVKLRGFRIETGEIESVLTRQPAVHQAVVVVHADAADPYLAAYVVLADGAPADSIRGLAPRLRESLPDYMVPSLFVPLAELPLTPNAKVDRSALRPPENAAPASQHEAPTTATESELAALWRDLLPPGTHVGRGDNFFGLGGHSMTVTRLIARIRAEYGVSLEVRDVFAAPTLEELAARLCASPDFRGRQLGTSVPPGATPSAVPPVVPSLAATGSPSDVLDDLSEDELETLLRAALERRKQRGTASPAAYPAGHGQRQLWFLDRLEPGQATYTMAASWRLHGRLRADLLQRAFGQLVDRHAAFRTTFATEDGELVQVVAPRGTATLEIADCPDAAAAARLRHEVSRQTFDLASGPLVRAVLARTGDKEHELTLAVHHAVFDEWSWGVAMHDLAELYRALRDGDAPRLPALTAHPAGAARGADEAADELRVEQDLAYWREQLRGAPELIQLPTDRPRPAVMTRSLGTHRFALPDSAADVLTRLRGRGYTPYHSLVTAWSQVLARASGQSDVVIGSVVGNRPEPELADRVGMFVSTVALRARQMADQSLGDALDDTRRVCVEALAHADAPFDRVTAELAPRRSTSYHPVFQVMFVLGPPEGDPGLGDIRAERLAVLPAGARFDLTLVMWEYAGQLHGRFDYNSDLFDEPTVRRLAAQLSAAVDALGGDLRRRAVDLPFLDQADRHALTTGRQPTVQEYAEEPLVPALITAQAGRTPDAPAVLMGSESLSYRDLLASARGLAARLRAVGVRPGTVVGLAVPTSPSAISALLGVQVSGGAYLPLDGASPPRRQADLLTAAAAPVLVTTRDWADRLDGYRGTVICVEDVDPVTDLDGADLHGEHPAYVIYTSGSTGRPKGVVVPHRAARNLALAFRDRHGFGVGDRILATPPLHFDASVGDVFPALVAGATLVLHPEPAALDGPALLRLCAEHAVTAVDAPSALWQRWVDDLTATDAPLPVTLTQMMVGGEPIPANRVRAWAERTGGRVSLVNHYGPTEATVCATTYDTADGAELDELPELPIGRPVANVRTYVLDRRGQLVPPGVVGELCIGGAGVAHGYLGSPGPTAEAFVPDPYAPIPGVRMYRTGDLARWGKHGGLEFLGRRDAQVKIRGRRIEPGEVEAAIARHPDVREAAVTAPLRSDGHRHLVAHVVPADGRAVSGADLRTFLRERVPDYLVPSAYVVMEALPTTPNGKVDRAALPPVDGSEERPAYTPPRTASERAVARIWSDALGVADVGREDAFLDLGGHSLLAATVLARVNESCQVTLPLRAMFEASTVEELAATVDAAQAGVAAGPRSGGAVNLSADLSAHLRAHLRAEARLPADIEAVADRYDVARRPEHIVLTGATGFLGGFLLADLLRTTDAQVHCIVRAGSVEEGRARIGATLARWGLDSRLADPGAMTRIDVVLGDLAAPRLGLGESDYARVAESADALLHNGGQVNFVRPYAHLRPANVGGTIEVLRLAVARRTSAVHFVSTLGVFLGSAYQRGLVTERDLPDDPAGLDDGYSQTKWVADALVRAARERGVPITIHRPARITGDSGTGIANPEDYFSALLKACVEVGAVPALAAREDMAPVDHVAAAITRACLDPDARGRSFHYFNGRTIGYDDIAAEIAGVGLRAEREDYRGWRHRIQRGVADGTVTAFAPYAALLPEAEPVSSQPVFDCTVTEAGAAQHGVVWPSSTTALLRRQLEHFVATGFLRRRGLG